MTNKPKLVLVLLTALAILGLIVPSVASAAAPTMEPIKASASVTTDWCWPHAKFVRIDGNAAIALDHCLLEWGTPLENPITRKAIVIAIKVVCRLSPICLLPGTADAVDKVLDSAGSRWDDFISADQGYGIALVLEDLNNIQIVPLESW